MAQDADAPQSYAMFVDESVRGNLIVVAGYIVALADVPQIITAWRDLKSTFGLEPEDELKWTMGKGDKTRSRLEAAGWPHARSCPELLRTIAKMPITAVADVLLASGERKPERHYERAFSWLLLWFRNALVLDRRGLKRPRGPHLVVVDRPPLADRTAAARDAYRDMYWNGTLFFKNYGIQRIESLNHLGFLPAVLEGHARDDDGLQIADALAGCVRDFIYYNLFAGDEEALPDESFPDKNFRLIAPRFRGYETRTLWTYGLKVFPQGHPRLAALRQLFERDWLYTREEEEEAG